MSATLFAIHSQQASLVIEAVPGRVPVWRHCGAKLVAGALPPEADIRAPASFSLNDEVPLTIAPVAGSGWFGPEILRCSRDGLSLTLDFDEAFVEQEETRIRMLLRDSRNGVTLDQCITVEPGGAFRFTQVVLNTGNTPLKIAACASLQVPLPQQSERLQSWRGRHNAEMTGCCEPMPHHRWVRTGRRGIPGHGGPPGVVVFTRRADEHAGLALSLQLAWSGDSEMAIERDDDGGWLLSAGAALLPGDVILQSGGEFRAPAAILAISVDGGNGAAAQHHAVIRQVHGWPARMSPRKVHLNSWEACYFAHDEARMMQLADAAAAIGVERFVLDDGWFKGRSDDSAGLGDWVADPVKYPRGLAPLASHVCSLGMEFGLWVEPEMANPDSDLLRSHPDWALRIGSQPGPAARNQVALNLGLPAVRDYLFDAIGSLLDRLPIAYLKWDHNRDLAPRGGPGQIAGLYALLERLREAHPAVEIESCAGGGGRIDGGIARYCQRFWASDNLDAVSRTRIQRGFLQFFPPEMMGSHIGASPAHATGRQQALDFRAAVAMQGHFGVELDPDALPQTERSALADWIAFYKDWRHLLHGGWVRQGEGSDGLVWQAQGCEDQFVLFVIRTAPPGDRRPQPLALPFLAGTDRCALRLLRVAGGAAAHSTTLSRWHGGLQEAPWIFSGSWLAHAGLAVPALKAESAAIFHGELIA